MRNKTLDEVIEETRVEMRKHRKALFSLEMRLGLLEAARKVFGSIPVLMPLGCCTKKWTGADVVKEAERIANGKGKIV